MIRKVHIDENGIVTEVQFVKETSQDEDFEIATTKNQVTNISKVEQDTFNEQSNLTISKKKDVKMKEKTGLRTKMKDLFRRKK